MHAGRRVRDDARGDARIGRHGLARRTKHTREGIAAHPLHDEVERAALLRELVDLADVRMMNARRDARLVEEHALELGLACEMRKDRLDGDELREPALAMETCCPNARHSTSRDRYEQLV